MPLKLNLDGRRFGLLVVVREEPKTPGQRRKVFCRCDCGRTASIDPRRLRLGGTESCGCLQRERVALIGATRRAPHGMCGSAEYNAWVKMRGRCYNSADSKFSYYGGRGIRVCDRWLASFDNFLADMGRRPGPGWSVDRLDVNGDYDPKNCRWATRTQQARNKRRHRLVEMNGRQVPLSQACEAEGINYSSALYRLNTGRDWRLSARGAA